MEEIQTAEPVAKINPRTRLPWTDEDRAAQSALAKELVRQRKFGGSVAGTRKKVPAYAVVAAAAQKNAKMLADNLLEIAQYGDTPKLRMDAIKMLLDIELKAQANRREEEEHLLTLPRDELQRMVLQKLAQLTGEDYDIETDAEEEDPDGYDES